MDIQCQWTLEGAFITRVSNSGTEDGNVLQKVEMVFKTVKIDYRPQNTKGWHARRRQEFQLGHPGGYGISIGLTGLAARATSPGLLPD
jgi:hypothetical protein